MEQAKSQLLLAKASLLAATAQKHQAAAQMSQSHAEVKESAHSVLVLAPLLAQRESRAAAVRLAQYNYEQCSVIAPFDARVTNLTISEGAICKSGQAIVHAHRQSDLVGAREFQRNANQTHCSPGTPVDVFLMSDTTRKFRGVVESASFGVTPDPDVVGKISEGLPEVQRTLNWVRLASRYPVRIKIIDPPPATLRVGQVAIVGCGLPSRALRSVMTTYGEYEPPVWKPVEMLRAELAWYPGRTCVGGKNRARLHERDGAGVHLSDSRRRVGRRLPLIDLAGKSAEAARRIRISNRPELLTRNGGSHSRRHVDEPALHFFM